MCVFMYVGEIDEYMWHDEMKKEAEFLRSRGTVARYTVEKGQPHRLETLAGANAAPSVRRIRRDEEGLQQVIAWWSRNVRYGLCEASREAKPKVVVAEGRIELAAQRDAAHGVRVAPRSAARGASHALVGARGIPLRRSAVVVLVVPVGAPLVHVRRDAEKAEVGRLAERHRPRCL